MAGIAQVDIEKSRRCVRIRGSGHAAGSFPRRRARQVALRAAIAAERSSGLNFQTKLIDLFICSPLSFWKTSPLHECGRIPSVPTYSAKNLI